MLARPFLLVCVFGLAAAAGHSDADRMDRLAGSEMIERLGREGVWSIVSSAGRVDYSCLVCGGPVEASVAVIPQKRAGYAGQYREGYLARRALYCAELVRRQAGRCIETRPVSMRGGALGGFQSTQQLGPVRETEIVFFYRDAEFGPEVIRAKISTGAGAELPDGAVDMFMWHMAKLTALW